NRLAHHTCYSSGITGGADIDIHRAAWEALGVHVERGASLSSEAVIPYIADNADDGELRRPKVDLLPQWILARPVRAGRGLVDDERWSILAGNEIPAAEHGNAKGAEVSRRDDVSPGAGIDRNYPAGVLDGEAIGLATTAERHGLAAAHCH